MMQIQPGTQPATAFALRDAPITETGREGGKAWMERGLRLLRQRRHEQAIAAFQEGLRTHPDPAFILNEASALLDSGRYAEAVLACDRYLCDPDAPRADEARAARQRARALMGGREATMAGIVESVRLLGQGAAAFGAARYEEALAAFEQAYELNPLPELRHNQAACLDRLGLTHAAAARYEDYLAVAPGSAESGKVAARIARLRAEASTAPITAAGADGGREATISRVAESGRLNGQGKTHSAAGRHADALHAFVRAYALNPGPELRFSQAACLDKLGLRLLAAQRYEAYLAEAPDAGDAAQVRARIDKLKSEATADAYRAFYRGVDAYLDGRWSAAARAFAEAYEDLPRAEFLYNQAAAHDRAGDANRAARYYRLYLGMSPDAADAARVRARIEALRLAVH
jgi:tetratricopeptide (TPR) repeat protein